MEQLYIAHLDFDEAGSLADLASIFQDLGFCISACERLLDLMKSGLADSILQQSLWTAALISYARCFATGKRFGLTPDIFSRFEGEPLECHQYYIDLRNKHIAHSVNPFEQVKVGAMLSPPDAARKEILGIATLGMKHIQDSVEGVEQLLLLTRTVRDEVSKRAKEMQEQVLEKCRSVPIEDLYKRASLRTTAPEPRAANRPR